MKINFQIIKGKQSNPEQEYYLSLKKNYCNIQGRCARNYYLDSISLIANWGESRECTRLALIEIQPSPLSQGNSQSCRIALLVAKIEILDL